VRLRETLVLSAAAVAFGSLAGFVPRVAESDGMAQLRQLGRGILMYKGDSNDTYPLAMGLDPNYPRWMWSKSTEAPAGLMRDTAPEMKQVQRCIWVNSVAPYWPSPETLAIPNAPIGGPRLKLEDTVSNPWLVGFNYNGLLHMLEHAAIAYPELVPVIWTGQGRANTEGRAMSSPTLTCDMVDRIPCKFGRMPDGYQMMRTSMFLQYGPAAAFDGAMVFGMADGSAMRLVPTLNREPGDMGDDPWGSYAADGKGMTYWHDDAGYPPLFRPDRKPKSEDD